MQKQRRMRLVAGYGIVTAYELVGICRAPIATQIRPAQQRTLEACDVRAAHSDYSGAVAI
jgi:hypothetical protein